MAAPYRAVPSSMWLRVAWALALLLSAQSCVSYKVLETRETEREVLSTEQVDLGLIGTKVSEDDWSLVARPQGSFEVLVKSTHTYARKIEWKVSSTFDRVEDDFLLQLIMAPFCVANDAVALVLTGPIELLSASMVDLDRAPEVEEDTNVEKVTAKPGSRWVYQVNEHKLQQVTAGSDGSIRIPLTEHAFEALRSGRSKLAIRIEEDGIPQFAARHVVKGPVMVAAAAPLADNEIIDGRLVAATPEVALSKWWTLRSKAKDPKVREAINERLRPMEARYHEMQSAQKNTSSLLAIESDIRAGLAGEPVATGDRNKLARQLLERSRVRAEGAWQGSDRDGRVVRDPEGAKRDALEAARIASSIDDLDLLEAAIRARLARAKEPVSESVPAPQGGDR